MARRAQSHQRLAGIEIGPDLIKLFGRQRLAADEQQQQVGGF